MIPLVNRNEVEGKDGVRAGKEECSHFHKILGL